MHTKSILIFIIFMQICGSYSEYGAHKCTKTGYELRTRVVPYRRLQTFSRHNWLGFVVHDKRYVTDFRNEQYYAQKTEYYCCAGYQEISNKCKPLCAGGCPMHANCIAPNTCKCDTGFRKNSINSCEPICANGCPINAYCFQPNNCLCQSGYRSNATANTLHCLPHCSNGCAAHSECAAPEKCRCQEGYADQRQPEQQSMQHDQLQCTPVCEERCPTHSSCISPNNCVCERGYLMQRHWQHRPYCEAQCEQDCSRFGKCVAPDVCECFAGYAMRNVSRVALRKTSESSATTPDNEYNAVTTASIATQATLRNDELCQPVCSSGCEHGVCVGPEVCVCNVGYLMGANSSCEPVCSQGCQNGRCIEPEICECAPGYILAENSVSVCVPHCMPSCINGTCIAPDFCLCWEQYRPKTDAVTALAEYQTPQALALAELRQHICVPICSVDCVNGECVEPETCRCHEGYALEATNSTHCMPHCQRCTSGDCVAPGECICSEGFVRVTLLDGEDDCVAISTTTITVITTTSVLPEEITISSTKKEWFSETLNEDKTTTAKPTKREWFPETLSEGTTTTTTTTESTASTDFINIVASSSSSTSNELESNATTQRCNTQCRCWQSSLQSHTHGGTKCSRICIDDYDQPCLQLALCKCDADQLHMTCPVQSTTNDESPEPLLLYFTCRVHLRNANMTVNEYASVSYEVSKAQAIHSAPWLLILGCIVGYSRAVMLGATVTL